MGNQELLQAMGQMLDKKFEPVIARLDKVDSRLNALETNAANNNKRLTNVEAKVNKIDDLEKNVVKINEKLPSLEKNVKQIDYDLMNVATHVMKLDRKLANVEGTLKSVQETVQDTHGRLRDVELTLENDIKRGIELLAEGQTPIFDKVAALEAHHRQLNEKVEIIWPATKRNSNEINKLIATNE
jgi:chromosome segregation ATPase